MATKRQETIYPGIFFREAKRIGKSGTEKVYYALYKKDGKLYEEKVGRQHMNDMTPAKAATIRGELIEGKRKRRAEIRAESKRKKWTISALWEEYTKQNPNLKGLIPDRSRFNKYIEKSIGNKEPSELMPLDIARLKQKYLKGKSPQTIKHNLTLVMRLINFGSNQGLTKPLSFKIQMPKVDNVRIEDLSSDQMIALLKAIEEDTHPLAGTMMKLVLFTGMRRGELFKLQWDDLDFNRGFIFIRDPKGRKSQQIPMNDSARKTLEDHPRKGENPYVFPGRGGGQRVDISKAVNRIKETAKLPKDFRPLLGLRHVYASMLASSGKVDMYTLQKLLTHKSPLMTQRYAHLRDSALKQAADVASDIISQAMKGDKVAKIK
jgi:integrase